MKIVTNVQFYAVGGIAQYLSALIHYNERASRAKIYGIDIVAPSAGQSSALFDASVLRNFKLLVRQVEYPTLGQALESATTLEDVRAAYRGMIDSYYECLQEIQPDCVIISGTYFMPWALLQAARRYGKAAIAIHYHGILTKETEHWRDERAKTIMAQMEREFDAPEAFYIFPSQLARDTVESLVFKHPIAHAAVVPNPVPDHFFSMPNRRRRLADSIGMVARWSRIKNFDFLMSLARYSKRKDASFSFPIITNLASDHKEYRRASTWLDVKEPVPHLKLPQFYKTLGVLILPSHFETYGNVAQEALAVGTPVLVSAAAGVAETFHFLGLGNWVHDFSSTAAVFEVAAKLAASSVPPHVRALLQLSFNSATIFKTYFGFLKEWV